MAEMLQLLLVIADKVLEAVPPECVLIWNPRFQHLDLLVDQSQHVSQLGPDNPSILHRPLQPLILLPVVLCLPCLQPSRQYRSRVWLKVKPPQGTTSDLTYRLEEIIPPKVGEGLVGSQILDSIKNLLGRRIRILLIPTFLRWEKG